MRWRRSYLDIVTRHVMDGVNVDAHRHSEIFVNRERPSAFDSSVGRAWDCKWEPVLSRGRWFEPGSKDVFDDSPDDYDDYDRRD
jgi:hypothetical protein